MAPFDTLIAYGGAAGARCHSRKVCKVPVLPARACLLARRKGRNAPKAHSQLLPRARTLRARVVGSRLVAKADKRCVRGVCQLC